MVIEDTFNSCYLSIKTVVLKEAHGRISERMKCEGIKERNGIVQSFEKSIGNYCHFSQFYS